MLTQIFAISDNSPASSNQGQDWNNWHEGPPYTPNCPPLPK